MSDSNFNLHPQLAADCITVGELPLCLVLLMNEARYPWFILVPMRDGMSEIHHLNAVDKMEFWHESAWFSARMEALFQPDKLNVAAIGNIVPQLHVHHIARFKDDAAWPAPVWGKFQPQAYDDSILKERLALVTERLAQYAQGPF